MGGESHDNGRTDPDYIILYHTISYYIFLNLSKSIYIFSSPSEMRFVVF